MFFQRLNSKWDLITLAREARERTGKSLLSQLREAVALRRSGSRLGLSEYYDYHLYDDAAFSADQKKTFAGTRLTVPVADALNAMSWRCVVDDKLLFFQLMQSLKLETPRITAVYLPRPRYCGDTPCFSSREPLLEFLLDAANYPMFTKPLDGTHSHGSNLLARVDPANRQMITSQDERLDLDAFIDGLPRPWAEGAKRTFRGQMFQQPARTPEEFENLFGAGLSTVRMVILLTENGPLVFRAALKVAAAGNIADNFWRPGNYLASIDLDSGEVQRVVRSTGHGIAPVDISQPDGKIDWSVLRVPQWDKLRELACRAASAFPEISMQSWDIAPTRDGSTLIEINAIGDLSLLQVVGREGILDHNFLKFLNSRGLSLEALGQ